MNHISSTNPVNFVQLRPLRFRAADADRARERAFWHDDGAFFCVPLTSIVFPQAFSGRKEPKEEKVSGRLKEWNIIKRRELFLPFMRKLSNVFRVTNKTLNANKNFFPPKTQKYKHRNSPHVIIILLLLIILISVVIIKIAPCQIIHPHQPLQFTRSQHHCRNSSSNAKRESRKMYSG